MKAKKVPSQPKIRLILTEQEAYEFHDYLMQRRVSDEDWEPLSGNIDYWDADLTSIRDEVLETLKEVLK